MKTKVIAFRNWNMAQAAQYDSDSSSEHESDFNDKSSSEDTDGELGCQEISDDGRQITPCKYYNKGNCKNGDSCRYSHVCMHALSGNCRYGSQCKLKHPEGQRAASTARQQSSDQPHPKLTDGRFYQWQLNDGNGWQNIDNDHVIEAQFSLPYTKSIKIYNTPYGAVTIDYKRMRIYGKDLKVRRLDDGNTVWTWYCILHHEWIKYGDKDSKGNSGPIKSSDIESKFQSNPTSSFTFTIGAETFEIRFREMLQMSKKRKRKVARRPVYRQQQAGAAVSQTVSALQNMSVVDKPQWQFEGKGGTWHIFKNRPECSVSSDDIEMKYQQNQSSMAFKVNGQPYKLDFGAMTQINLTTKHKRKVRRVLI